MWLATLVLVCTDCGRVSWIGVWQFLQLSRPMVRLCEQNKCLSSAFQSLWHNRRSSCTVCALLLPMRWSLCAGVRIRLVEKGSNCQLERYLGLQLLLAAATRLTACMPWSWYAVPRWNKCTNQS